MASGSLWECILLVSAPQTSVSPTWWPFECFLAHLLQPSFIFGGELGDANPLLEDTPWEFELTFSIFCGSTSWKSSMSSLVPWQSEKWVKVEYILQCGPRQDGPEHITLWSAHYWVSEAAGWSAGWCCIHCYCYTTNIPIWLATSQSISHACATNRLTYGFFGGWNIYTQ